MVRGLMCALCESISCCQGRRLSRGAALWSPGAAWCPCTPAGTRPVQRPGSHRPPSPSALHTVTSKVHVNTHYTHTHSAGYSTHHTHGTFWSTRLYTQYTLEYTHNIIYVIDYSTWSKKINTVHVNIHTHDMPQ